jgi:hypothetical protein
MAKAALVWGRARKRTREAAQTRPQARRTPPLSTWLARAGSVSA